MTRKHYEAIARAMVTARKQAEFRSTQFETIDMTMGLVISRLMDVFEADNPNFDGTKFGKACEKDNG